MAYPFFPFKFGWLAILKKENTPDKIKPAPILIVDDIPENLIALETILGRLDVTVVKATSGNDALTETLKHDFALIILDVQMPGMNGYEVADILHEEGGEFAAIPIIFVTAIDRSEEKELRGYQTGAIDFLFKPINKNILLSKVKVFLELYQMRKNLSQLVEERTEQLDSSETKYRQIFENAIEGIFQSTPEGQIINANPALVSILGYASTKELTEIESIGKTLYVDPVKREELLKQLQSKNIVSNYECQFYKKNRQKIWVSLKVRSIRDAWGNLEFIEGLLEDITLRKENENRLESPKKS